MDLRSLEQHMRRLGVTHLLVKPLAPNDNSKNQIYLGAATSRRSTPSRMDK